MQDHAHKAIAIVGVGAVLPDAPNAKAFWQNIKDGRDSITEVLYLWADSLLSYGIKEIKGDLIVDNSFFTGCRCFEWCNIRN